MAEISKPIYKEERFEFALYVNNNLICKRNFKINDFIEHSMESLEFKDTVDTIVNWIDDDLKSKSRIYTWYYFNPNDPELFEMFAGQVPEPWECTFRFEVLDNKKVVISKIWDGYAYPKPIRDKVDIGNKTVKIVTKEGKVYSFDKDKYFADNADRLSFDMQVVKAMITDKHDLLIGITQKICEVCSTHEELFSKIGDYTMSEAWGKDADGKKVTYNFNIAAQNKKLERKWMKLAAESYEAKTNK